MPRLTDRTSVFELVRPALIDAGLISATGDLLDSPQVTATRLLMALRQIKTTNPTDPWGEPFTLVIGSDWRSIDGSEPGEVQMCVTENGIQIREWTPVEPACVAVGHFVFACGDCWTTRMLHASNQWYPVTERVQVRPGVVEDGKCRVEIQRRTHPGEVQAEAVWSEPWEIPRPALREESDTVHREYDNSGLAYGCTT